MRKSFILSVIATTTGCGVSAARLTPSRFFFIGMALVILGAAGILHGRSMRKLEQVNRPADEAYELGYQMGYDRGYTQGHKEARPVVVPLQREPEGSFSSTAMR